MEAVGSAAWTPIQQEHKAAGWSDRQIAHLSPQPHTRPYMSELIMPQGLYQLRGGGGKHEPRAQRAQRHGQKNDS